MIYFIQAGTDGPIKIGYAVEPWNRIKQLQVASHEELILLKAISGDQRREKEIHKLLSAHKKQGEWFHPAPEVIQFIKSLEDAEYEVIDLRAYAVLRRDTEKSETDPCPFCGRGHRHGIGDGHRVAHCSGSEIKEEVQVDRVILRKADGYILRTRWKDKPSV